MNVRQLTQHADPIIKGSAPIPRTLIINVLLEQQLPQLTQLAVESLLYFRKALAIISTSLHTAKDFLEHLKCSTLRDPLFITAKI